jgi:hypothetical protein
LARIGGSFLVKPQEHQYIYVSVQNNTYECDPISDDWDRLMEYWREWAAADANCRGSHWVEGMGARRNTPAQEIPNKMTWAILARGWSHYGNGVRPRCYLEIWVKAQGTEYAWQEQVAPANEYAVLHLEHVGEGWSAIADMAENIDPVHMYQLAHMDAFKNYKR